MLGKRVGARLDHKMIALGSKKPVLESRLAKKPKFERGYRQKELRRFKRQANPWLKS
jgi:hypothetical protein